MTEREILLTGIGGQGVQLAARVLAEAALVDGKEVQLFASYGGMMRGGNTDAAVVISDESIDAPPVVSQAWAVIGVHPEYLADPLERLRPDGVLVLNTTIVDADDLTIAPGVRRLDLACSEVALGIGNAMAGALVAVGALAAWANLVAPSSLEAGVERALPSYRRQHVESSVAALVAGAELVA